MAVSVVVRVLNSERTIEDCLRSLFSQAYSNYEVLVVDDHSVDRTLEIAQRYPTRIFQNRPGRNPCNCGIEEARNKIVAFIDSDCVAPPTWLTQIVGYFSDEEVAVVGGEETAPAKSGYWPRCIEALMRMEKRFLYHWGPVERIITCNVAYRRDVLVELGGFSDYLFGGEEVELGWRLSRTRWKAIFDPGIQVLHNRRSSPGKFARQQFNYGLGNGRVVRMHPAFIKPSHAALLALPPTAFLLIALTITGRADLAVYLVSALMTVAALATLYAGSLAKEVKLVPGIFLAGLELVFAKCLGFLVGLATPVPRHGTTITHIGS